MTGRELSHFRVLEQIGAGGMGVVYRGVDVRLGRPVALKVLQPEALSDPQRRRRFEREARAASALNHPGIVTVYEVGSEGDVDFIAMELVEGQTLRELLGTGSLKPKQAARLAAEVASALAAAHEKGIVHRDLKPENVIVTTDGRAKILDFGLAGTVPEAAAGSQVTTAVTRPGTVLGSAGYMAPEQVRGQQADARSDVFALGAVLYEMLTGERAFRGATRVETMNAVLNAEPAQLDGASVALPPGLKQVVGKCLRKAPGERYASAREVAVALETLRELELLKPTREPPRRRARTLLATAGVLALAALVVFALRVPLAKRGAPRPVRSIAVLPLADLSADASHGYFADGMTDALIGELSRIRALRVISRTSTQRYRNTKTPLSRVAAELGVEAVVEGSVLWSGERVRVSAQLSDALEDRTLWAESYERDLADVLALQRELAAAITQEVRVQLTKDERTRLAAPASAVDPVAYEAYLQGRHHYAQSGPEHARKAMEFFQNAIARSPAYAPAYAGLSSVYGRLGSVEVGRPSPEMKALAEAAARKALELDGGLAEAHAALGFVQLTTWRWTAAERSFRNGIEADPSNVRAHLGLSHFFSVFGLADESIAEVRQVKALDPFTARSCGQVGFMLINAHRYDDALAELRHASEMDPTDGWVLWNAGVAQAELGRFEQAIATLERAVSLSKDSPAFLGTLGNACARAGLRRRALAIRDELTARRQQDYVTPAAFVFVNAGLGDKERAFEWLEKAAADQTNLMQFLRVHPLLDPLRSEPRFDAMLRRVGLAR
jgi:eukaryotic-like serine/threonine-protein kinase